MRIAQVRQPYARALGCKLALTLLWTAASMAVTALSKQAAKTSCMYQLTVCQGGGYNTSYMLQHAKQALHRGMTCDSLTVALGVV
jgi:hypothetical protein